MTPKLNGNLPRLLLLATLFACRTGSNFETLQSRAPKTVADSGSGAVTGPFYIRPFTFAEMNHRSEMYRKAFVVPGFKGIDFDTYGRSAAADEKSGMKTIASLANVHALVADELTKQEIKTIANEPEEGGRIISVKVLGTESSLRMHTYGCWPFVGTFVYIVNGDIYTVLSYTRAEYTITDGGAVRSGMLEVYTRKEFGFWSTWAGMEILDSFTEAQEQHAREIAAALAQKIRQP